MPRVIKACVAITATLIALGDAAMARPDLRAMTCDQARALVHRNGAVVFTTGPRTYEKFVVARWGCELPYRGTSAYVATKDRKNCRIGFRCELLPHPLEDWDW